MIRTMALLPVVMLVLNGCVIAVNTDDIETDWHDRQDRNERIIHRLDLGESLNSVEDQLGKADFRESFLRDGQEFDVLFYRTHRSREDGKTTKDETTPLVFVDGELVGYGESAIDHATAH